MKITLITVLLTIFSFCSFGQKLEISSFELIESLPEWIMLKTEKVNLEQNLIVDEKMNPFYLESDFNGDKILDIAFCVKEKETNKKGILFIHGNSFESFLIGAGNSFAHVGDNFRFLEIWKVYRDREVGLTEFAENGDIIGTKIITIETDAVLVSKSESSPNLIAWQNGKYVWLHMGD